MSEKKEIKIPRLWVYLAAFVSGLAVTTIFGLAFGVQYALDFVTNAAIFGVLFVTAYNVWDKVDKQTYRLTWKYWVLIALIVVTDFLFLFAAKAEVRDTCIVRLCIFAVGLTITGFYAYFIYAPSQREIFAAVKEASKAQLKAYLEEHAGESADVVAEGILELMFAPKKEEEAPEGEEVNE